MLTLKIKSSESAVALKCISQLRRPGISNLVPCQFIGIIIIKNKITPTAEILLHLSHEKDITTYF